MYAKNIRLIIVTAVVVVITSGTSWGVVAAGKGGAVYKITGGE